MKRLPDTTDRAQVMRLACGVCGGKVYVQFYHEQDHMTEGLCDKCSTLGHRRPVDSPLILLSGSWDTLH